MKKEGQIRGINYFEHNGVPLGLIVIDRHLQVAKFYIDVSHVAKGNKNTILPKNKLFDIC